MLLLWCLMLLSTIFQPNRAGKTHSLKFGIGLCNLRVNNASIMVWNDPLISFIPRVQVLWYEMILWYHSSHEYKYYFIVCLYQYWILISNHLEFHRHKSWYFVVLNGVKQDAIVLVIYIEWIIHHHCWCNLAWLKIQ
jgi:hypothetical protein